MTVSSETARAMLRQAARWTTAAEQDDHPFIALLHANYGVGTIVALRQLAPDGLVYRLTGIDPWRVERYAVQVQERAALALSRSCPELAQDLGPLAALGGEVDPRL